MEKITNNNEEEQHKLLATQKTETENNSESSTNEDTKSKIVNRTLEIIARDAVKRNLSTTSFNKSLLGSLGAGIPRGILDDVSLRSKAIASLGLKTNLGTLAGLSKGVLGGIRRQNETIASLRVKSNLGSLGTGLPKEMIEHIRRQNETITSLGSKAYLGNLGGLSKETLEHMRRQNETIASLGSKAYLGSLGTGLPKEMFEHIRRQNETIASLSSKAYLGNLGGGLSKEIFEHMRRQNETITSLGSKAYLDNLGIGIPKEIFQSFETNRRIMRSGALSNLSKTLFRSTEHHLKLFNELGLDNKKIVEGVFGTNFPNIAQVMSTISSEDSELSCEVIHAAAAEANSLTENNLSETLLGQDGINLHNYSFTIKEVKDSLVLFILLLLAYSQGWYQELYKGIMICATYDLIKVCLKEYLDQNNEKFAIKKAKSIVLDAYIDHQINPTLQNNFRFLIRPSTLNYTPKRESTIIENIPEGKLLVILSTQETHSKSWLYVQVEINGEEIQGWVLRSHTTTIK